MLWGTPKSLALRRWLTSFAGAIRSPALHRMHLFTFTHVGVPEALGSQDGSSRRMDAWTPPSDPNALPFELRRELPQALAHAVRKALEEKGLTEEEILADFEPFRQARSR